MSWVVSWPCSLSTPKIAAKMAGGLSNIPSALIVQNIELRGLQICCVPKRTIFWSVLANGVKFFQGKVERKLEESRTFRWYEKNFVEHYTFGKSNT